MSALQGKMLGGYRLLERIGRGGMGDVYRAQHLRLGREAAIKVLHTHLASDPDFLRRFEREAASVARLDHPSILPIWEFGEQDGSPYLVMPLMRGGNLADRLRREALTPDEIVSYLRDLASALDYAHRQGLIHRDVKPANMLLTDQRGRAMLADFGIAKVFGAGESLTRTGVGLGTAEYMAPEQFQGQADQRSDLYALGVVLYQMLTGRVPFAGTTPYEVITKHLQERLPPVRQFNPSVPLPLESVVTRALARDPDQRYQSGADLMAAIDTALHPHPGIPTIATTVPPTGLVPASPGGPATVFAASPITPPAQAAYPPVAPSNPYPLPAPVAPTPPNPSAYPLSVPPGPIPMPPAVARARVDRLPLVIGGAIGAVAVAIFCVGLAFVLARRPETSAKAPQTATAGTTPTVLAGAIVPPLTPSVPAPLTPVAPPTPTAAAGVNASATAAASAAAQAGIAASATAQAQATGTARARVQATGTAQAQASGTAQARGPATLTAQAVSVAATRASIQASAVPAQASATAIAARSLIVYGPQNGRLEHNAEGAFIIDQRANVNLANLTIEAKFYNPYQPAQGGWDYGFFFRDTGVSQNYRIVVTSGHAWALELATGDANAKRLASGGISNMDLAAGGANSLKLVVSGNTALFFVNDAFVATLDVSAKTAAGDVRIGTGFYTGSQITGRWTAFEGFTISRPR
jgi:serine/threonine protein kinase